MFHRKALSLLVFATALAGCSTTTPIVITRHQVEFEQDNRSYIHSVETTEDRPLQMGGTAILEPATIHVLDDHRRTSIPVDTVAPKPRLDRSLVMTAASQLDAIKGDTAGDKLKRAQIVTKAIKEMNEIEANDQGKRVDAYDMVLWRRYCNDGKEMTSDDWSQMLGSSTDQIPEPLLKNCHPPSLQLSTALIHSFCSKEMLTNKEQYIVEQNKNDQRLACK